MRVGIDVVDIERFRQTLNRSPGLTRRFFTPDEISYCENNGDRVLHLAATFAAKEAVMKAVSLTPAAAMARRIEIVRASTGAPSARVDGRDVALSISHDGGLAVAIALSL